MSMPDEYRIIVDKVRRMSIRVCWVIMTICLATYYYHPDALSGNFYSWMVARDLYAPLFMLWSFFPVFWLCQKLRGIVKMKEA